MAVTRAETTAQSAEPPAESHSERLALGTKLAYALPGMASSGLALPIYALMPKFYSDVYLVPLGLIALSIAVARAFDAITDPAMGWLSDRVPTRWGRRRPWIALGVPFTAVCILAMFGPPAGLSPTTAAAWFGATFAAYFLFHTVYFVPYGALGFELTLDYNERSSLFGWAQAMSLFGNAAAGFAPLVIEEFYGDDQRAGFLMVGWVFGFLLIGMFGWMLMRIQERPEFVARESNPIVPGVRRTLRNPPFRRLLVVYVISSLTGAIPATVAPFYIPEVLKPENPGAVLTYTIVGYVVSGALSIPVWVYLAKRLGKRGAWFISIWVGIIGGSTFFFVGEGQIALFLTAVVFTGTALGAGLLHPAMKADVIDYDEFLTGKRREAQYASFWAMVPKFVVIPSAAIPLGVLAAVGYESGAASQPEQVSFALRTLLGLAPAVTGIVAFLVALGFPMTEARHRAVLAGIRRHQQGLDSEDPLTGETVAPPQASEVDEKTAWFLDHFSRRELRSVLRSESGVRWLPWRVALCTAVSVLLVLGLSGWVVVQVQDLSQTLGTLVTLAVVGAGFALAGACFHALRWPAAIRLRRGPPPEATLCAHLGLDHPRQVG